ncbi:hypothetical protein LC613_18955 [Nostoc sphaeroides CHAB 2801]|uniref:hypothetical protein n=1 Tax=Nostoc sphaeroides TaxID=446679 RepID=UPI0015F32A51|nr:hypothetical protein [Nostoc sphaeroides]MCC5630004.1 hypothetical protein [Nostoc sphaeroides CHAB 2801]
MTVDGSRVFSQQSTVNSQRRKKIFHCYCSLLTVDGSRVFSQQSTVNDFNVE